MRVSISKPDVCIQNSTIFMPNNLRQAHSPADGLALTDTGKRKVQLVQCRLCYTEKDRKQGATHGSVINLFSSKLLYRSCIHHEMPLKSFSTIMFLDKSLCISLTELKERRTGQPTLFKSALSCRFGVSSYPRLRTDTKQAKTNEGYEKARVILSGSTRHISQKDALGHCRRPLSKHGDCKAKQTAPTHCNSCKGDDSDTQRHSTSFGLLSFRGLVASNAGAGRRKGNADEAACPAWSNFRHRQRTFNTDSGEPRARSRQAGSNKTDEEQEDGRSAAPETVATLHETCHYHSQLKKDSVGGSPKTLSLQEALELCRPDFISRSQGRVRRLEQRVRRRKVLQDSNPDLVQGLREDRGKQKRNCTTPDPLSDNLFKPRERSISGKEMQLRSRRIYNKLPEVTKKKEEEKKRAVSQSNRLRAEVFKKRLLDQILQR